MYIILWPFKDISEMLCVGKSYTHSVIILWMRQANARRRYNVTSSLIGWVHTHNNPCAFDRNHNKIKQDRRWNADKPSAALDPYIPTWLTTSSANHRPANFSKSFFFFLKHWKEIVKSGAISCWTDVDQFQIWSFHSLILLVQIITDIIYQSILGMFT